ncbi:hypothetical protein KDL01_09285 [Actinospica durhamensis]|uniref:ABC transport system permease protein n=1 Tax=Actinospica durhamensis TaxID=1508375 RepID=A0A941IPT3_9ACTN|nr:FtsX-like permease family protein [Actinospica durhamensis]MBR7833457.1 hypothetical protein [Actinospica durhamensis]
MDSLRSLIRPVAHAWRRPAGLVLAVLTACFLLASATGVRTDLAARDRALQTMLSSLPASAREITASTDFDQYVAQSSGISTPDAIQGDEIAVALDGNAQDAYTAVARASAGVPLAPASAAWTSLGSPTYYVGKYTTQFVAVYSGEPEIQIGYLGDYAQHARLTAGRWPKAVKLLRSGLFSVEVALPESELTALGLHVGSPFMARSGGSVPPPPIVMVVTGAYQPIDPDSAYWQDQPTDVSQQPVRVKGSTPYVLGGGLLGQDELAYLAALQPFASQGLNMVTHVPLQTASVKAGQVDGLITAIDSALTEATSDLDSNSFIGSDMTFTTPLVATLAQFDAEQQAGQLETAMPGVGLALIGLIALLMAARGTVDREAAQNAVLRARGAPLWKLAGGAARDSAFTVVPLCAAAAFIAALIPGRSPSALWKYELLLPVIAVAGPAALTALRLRHRPSAAARRGAASAGRNVAARRIVVQGALILLCFLGLAEARSTGFSAGGGIDLFTAAAPVLSAVLVALVILNLGPLLLRALLRAADRRTGAIGLLGLARTARTPAPAAVTVLILTLALATADLTLALRRAGGAEGAAAAAAQQIYRVSAYSGTSTFSLPAQSGPDALVNATAGYLSLLAVMAVATGCLVVALATALEAKERRTVVARLTTMGLTAGQARAVAVVELLGPIVFAAVGGTVSAAPLLWSVRPALSQALGGADAQVGTAVLALPLIAVIALALGAGMAAAAAARRGVTGTLRLGDQAEGA